MRKIISITISLIILLLFCGCSSETVPSENNKPLSEKIDFSEVTVVSNEECLIKITGINPDNAFGYTLNAYIENKSSDKNYMFSVEKSAINNVECDPFFATEISPGKKSNENIIYDIDELKELGINNVTDIEITFRVYNSEDWEAEDIVNETVHIYPYGAEKAESFQRESKSTDNIIVDDENATVIVTGYENDEIMGYTVKMYIVNKSDKNLMFTVDRAAVNGFMADPYYSDTVGGGKSKISTMSWSDETFAEQNIETVDSIEFLLRAYDNDNYMANDLVSEDITLNP